MSSNPEREESSVVPSEKHEREESSVVPSEVRRWRIRVPRDKFRLLKDDHAFAAIMALGRAVNSLHFVLGPLANDTGDDDPVSVRARFNGLLAASSLFAEAILLVKGMHKHFKQHAHFQKLVKTTTSEKGREVLNSHLFKVRNKMVFHFDEEEFEAQLKTHPIEEPIFVSGSGKEKGQLHYQLADSLAVRALLGGVTLDELRSKVRELAAVIISFLNTADEFMVVIARERDWLSPTMEFDPDPKNGNGPK